MIARMLRALRRRLLLAEIRDGEADLAAIGENRKNDDAAEKIIRAELITARHPCRRSATSGAAG